MCGDLGDPGLREKAGGILSSEDLVPSQAVRKEKAAPAAPSTLTPTGHLPRGSGPLAHRAALPGSPAADTSKGCFVQAQGPGISQHLHFHISEPVLLGRFLKET